MCLGEGSRVDRLAIGDFHVAKKVWKGTMGTVA